MLSRYIGGDQSAFDELVNCHREAAFWASHYVVNDDKVASDVVQDAFALVLQRHEHYDPVRPFKTWFLQIVRKLSIDAIRRRRNQAGPDVLDRKFLHGPSTNPNVSQKYPSVLEKIPP